MRNRATPAVSLSLLITVVTWLVGGCATNPVSGTPDLVFMTEAKEIQLGQENDPRIRSQYGVYDNAALQAYVQQVGQRLAAKSHRPGLTYHFVVLDSSEVNAFALPGGYVYITRGLLAYINSEAELAAVLGHEIGHVTARHAVRQYTAATTTGVLGMIIGATTGIQGSQDLFNNTVGNAILSGYGRDHELEADRLGAEYIARVGYDPDAMIGVIGILKNQEEFEKKRAAAENRAPRIYHGVFATHPSADRRLQEVVGEAAKFKTLSAPRLAREDYLKQLDGLAFGDSAREGIRRGRMFYHRDLALALAFPEGWHIENTPSAIVGWPPQKDALLMVEMRALPADSTASLESFLKSQVKLGADFIPEPLPRFSYPSTTGKTRITGPFGVRETRVTAIHYGQNAWIFFGASKEPGAFAQFDREFLATASSLRPLRVAEKPLAAGLHVRVVNARAGDTFENLAKSSPLEQYGESLLRLINDKFPDGEPQAGALIKIIE